MPVYEYACTECGQRLEARQSFTDEPLTTCDVCGGPLRKLLSPVGVVFKGSGFYRTDSRGAPPSEAGSGNGKTDADSGKSTSAPAEGAGSSKQSGEGKGPSRGKGADSGQSSGSDASSSTAAAKSG